MFDPYEVAEDRERVGEHRGPFPAWILFIWLVNDMVPGTFATEDSPKEDLIIKPDEPARGWLTEQYPKARVMRPPVDSDAKIAIVADDFSLYPVWDKAMQMVVSGNIHTHEKE